MPKPHGEQWQKLYRGLLGVSPDQVDTKETGPHWTTDPDIAMYFATGRDVEGNLNWDYEEQGDPLSGTMLEAKVHRRHIIDEDSDEGREWQAENVLGKNSIEREHTVRPGAIIHPSRMFSVSSELDLVETPVKRRRGWRA